MPTLRPVNYDPFAPQGQPAAPQSRGATLKPVNFNPFAGNEPSAPAETTPSWAGDYPNVYAGLGTLHELNAPQFAGMAGGAATGAAVGALGGPLAPITVPAGAIIGAGFGYAAGRPAQKALGESLGNPQPETTPAQLGTDIATGALYEAGGRAVGAAAQKLPGLMKRAGERLIGSELKVPPTIAADEVKAARDLIRRTKATPDEAGMKALNAYADTTNRTVESILRPGHDLGETIPRSKLIQALTEYKNEQMIQGNKDAVEALIKDYQRQPKNIPLLDALKLKQQIYKDISDSAYKEAYTGAASLSNVQTQGLRGVASTIKTSLDELYPAIKPLTEAQKGTHIAEKSINRHIVESLSSPLTGHEVFSTVKKVIKPALSAVGVTPTKLGLRLTQAGEALGRPLGEKVVIPTAQDLITEAEHIAAGRLPARIAAEKEAARIMAERYVTHQARRLQGEAAKTVLARLAKEQATAQAVKDEMASRIVSSMKPDVKKALAEKEALVKELLQRKSFNLDQPQVWSGAEQTPFQGGVNWRFKGRGRLEHTPPYQGGVEDWKAYVKTPSGQAEMDVIRAKAKSKK